MSLIRNHVIHFMSCLEISPLIVLHTFSTHRESLIKECVLRLVNANSNTRENMDPVYDMVVKGDLTFLDEGI